jgi:hypothetical protein
MKMKTLQMNGKILLRMNSILISKNLSRPSLRRNEAKVKNKPRTTTSTWRMITTWATSMIRFMTMMMTTMTCTDKRYGPFTSALPHRLPAGLSKQLQ